MSDQTPMTPPEDAAANRRSSRSDSSVLFSAHLRATRKMLSLRFDYRTTDYQVVDGIRLLDEAADEIDRLRDLVGKYCAALQTIVNGGYAAKADQAHPAIGIARKALGRDGPNMEVTHTASDPRPLDASKPVGGPRPCCVERPVRKARH